MISDIRAIAFYLPQYHPVKENDEWWGKGFTEWTNTAKARPLFPGHYQPHIPADLGFYDLRLSEARQAQADLAREYGIHGFCYYHYWFNGRRILERPFNEVLQSGRPDFPFCLCWANENWTRVWDGGERDVLLGQNYNHEDDFLHIQSLIPAFRDPRYIRINGRPLFLVYRTELLPDPARTAEIWREVAIKAGVGDPYLVRVESFSQNISPASIGFDAAVEFAPDGNDMGEWIFHHGAAGILSRMGVIPHAYAEQRIVSYPALARGMASRPVAEFTRFRCVTPMWDNSARRKKNARIVIDSTPELYESWLRVLCNQTSKRFKGDERVVFINAWNEWAEGNHLEPDLKWGHEYLKATRRALTEAGQTVHFSPVESNASTTHDFSEWLKSGYWKWRARLGRRWVRKKELLRLLLWRWRR
ncbi:MAG TPA: glycoside hydrolase family 99-like domain-containing protein [Pseudomonadales bacterium]|nr:glycoside hydrolase family 99-like domain-containing protein [Pseudomonadales bacterium]